MIGQVDKILDEIDWALSKIRGDLAVTAFATSSKTIVILSIS